MLLRYLHAPVIPLLCGILAVSLVQAQPSPLLDVREAYGFAREGLNYLEGGDREAYLARLQQAHDRAGHLPAIKYHLARALVLNSRLDEGISLLSEVAAMGLYEDVSKDSVFFPLDGHETFDVVRRRFEANREPTGTVRVGFELSDPSFFPEGVAYDPHARSFYVGSVHKRAIARVDAMGRDEIIVPPGMDGIWSVMGLAVDPERRLLWVTTSAIKQTSGIDSTEIGQAGLFRYHLEPFKLSGKYLPATGETHSWGDLAIDRDGNVFVSDGRTGSLYVLRHESERIEQWLDAGTFQSPQGMCFSEDGKRLYVADYAAGIFSVDPKSRTITRVGSEFPVAATGIDGLACYGNSLVAVQNGFEPHRVVRFMLSDTGDTIVRQHVLQAGLEPFDEPTLGVLVGDDFYYVANSHWGRYGPDGRPIPGSTLQPPIVLRCSLLE